MLTHNYLTIDDIRQVRALGLRCPLPCLAAKTDDLSRSITTFLNSATLKSYVSHSKAL